MWLGEWVCFLSTSRWQIRWKWSVQYQCQYFTIHSSISECDHKCETRNAEPEIGTDESSQTRRKLRVDGYRSGFGPPRVSRLGFGPGLEPIRSVFAFQTRTAGGLPGPVANTTAEANKSGRPIDPAITASAKVFLDTKDSPITYANVNPMQCRLVHRYIGPSEILRIRGNAVELVLPNDMTICDTVNVSRLKVDRTDDSRITWLPPHPLVRTSRAGTSYIVESIAKHQPSSDGTSWEYKVKWEGWDEMDNTWEPEEIMANAKEMVKQYWKEIGGRPKAKRKATQRKAWEACLFFDQGVLFLREVSRRWLEKVVI